MYPARRGLSLPQPHTTIDPFIYGLLDALDRPEILGIADHPTQTTSAYRWHRPGLSPLRRAAGQFGLLDTLQDAATGPSVRTIDYPATAIRFTGRASPLADGRKVTSADRAGILDSALSHELLSDFDDRVVDSFVQAGKNLWTGYRVGASGFYDTLGSAVGLLNRGNDFMTELTGIGEMSEGTVWKDAEDWLHATAARVSPTSDELPKDIVGKIYAGIGQAPVELVQLLPAMRLLKPTLGMATIGGLREADQGWEAAANGAAKAALLGHAANALSPLRWIERSAGLGALGAASTFGQGSSPEDAITYGLLGVAGVPKAKQPNLLPLRMAYDDFIEAANHADNRLGVIRGLTPQRRKQEVVQINNTPGIRLEDVARASDAFRGFKTGPGGRYKLPPLPGLRRSRKLDYRRSKFWVPRQEVEVKREGARYPREQELADERLKKQGVRITKRRESEILRRARIQLGKEGRFDRQAIELARWVHRHIPR